MSTTVWSSYVVPVGVATGVGAGFLLGLVSAQWLWDWRQRRRLARAVAELREEIALLRQTLSEVAAAERARSGAAASRDSGRKASSADRGGGQDVAAARRPLSRPESSTEFLSAQEDESEEESEFYELSTPEEEEGSISAATARERRLQEYDELGKATLESVEACSTLLEKLKAGLEKDTGDVEVLWRLSRCLVQLSTHHKSDEEMEKQYLEQAANYAQEAIAVNDNSWKAHEWYAMAIGSQSKFLGTQDKIKSGFLYKEHIDKAVTLNPEYSWLYYLRGRWCFEVAGLSWMEKKAAAMLYASPPESSIEEALQNFLKADELSTEENKSTQLYTAKCYLKLGSTDKAIECLQKALSIATLNNEDTAAHTEAEQLLEQYSPS